MVFRLYCGTLVHRVVQELKRGIRPESMLVRGSDAEHLFRLLNDAVLADEVTGEEIEAKGQEADKTEGYSCTIRTRHKAKERNTMHPAKKFDRRCFE